MRFHTLDALQRIANHDAGRNASDWTAWYEKNKDKAERQWVREGFIEAGLPVADPVDLSFALALIRTLGVPEAPKYLRSNAERYLRSVPRKILLLASKEALAAPEPGYRHGAMAALGFTSGPDVASTVGPYLHDSDGAVAQRALWHLNEVQRTATLQSINHVVWERRLSHDDVRILAVDRAGARIYLAGGSAGTMAMDLRSLRVLWTYRNRYGAVSPAALVGKRLAFVAGDGTLRCLSVGGTLLWERRLNLTDGPYHGNPVVLTVGSNVLVIDRTSIRRINIQDGNAVGETITGLDIHAGIARNDKHIYVPSFGGELLILSSLGELEQRLPADPTPIGVSADSNTYCMVTRKGKDWASKWELRCFAQDDSHEIARTEVEADTTSTAEVSQSEGIVYIQRQVGRAAYESLTGKRLWAVSEYADMSDHLFGHYILIRTGRDIEWRDLRTGQVCAYYKDSQGLRFQGEPVLFGGRLLTEGKIVQRPHLPLGALGFYSYELGTLRLLAVPKDVLSQPNVAQPE